MTSRGIGKVVLVMSRARVLQRYWHREEVRLARRRQPTVRPSVDPEQFGAWVLASLYLASMHSLIEVWEESLLYDQGVDEMLKTGYTDELRRFRNALLHSDPFFETKARPLMKNFTRTVEWTDSLLDAIGRFSVREAKIQTARAGRIL